MRWQAQEQAVAALTLQAQAMGAKSTPAAQQGAPSGPSEAERFAAKQGLT